MVLNETPKRRKNNQGFTLIEVLVAFTFFAVMSAALLQMIILTSEVNSKAQIKSKITGLAVEILELYKNNPALECRPGNDIGCFENGLEDVYGLNLNTKPEIDITDGSIFKKYILYYDHNFNLMPGNMKDDSSYIAEITLKQTEDKKQISSYINNPIYIKDMYVYGSVFPISVGKAAIPVAENKVVEDIITTEINVKILKSGVGDEVLEEFYASKFFYSLADN